MDTEYGPPCRTISGVIASGNAAELQRLITYGLNVHRRRSDGATLLHEVAERGEVKIAEMLLAAGARVDAVYGVEITPIQSAAWASQAAIAKLLIEWGANVNKGNSWTGYGPLHIAAWHDDRPLARALIDAGADLDRPASDFGQAPLHFAAYYGNPRVAGLLIDAGAHIEARDNSDYTPLHTAIARDHIHAAQVLVWAGADVHARTEDQTTALHIAAYRGNVDAIDLLLTRGADVNAQSNREEEDGFRAQGQTVVTGITPLHAAATCGHLNAVARLLRAGADAAAEQSNGLTPADVALSKGHVEVRRFLSRVSAPQR